MEKINDLKSFIKKNVPFLYNILIKLMDIRRYYLYRKYVKLNPDKYQEIISSEYKKILGRELDWNNLRTYNEKMQWAKLYDNSPIKTTLSDKYEVRNWVGNKIGKEYLIPIYGVWNSFDEIDFSELPQTFVLKTNHGSGTNLIVKDKKQFNINRAKRKFDEWMNINFAFYGGLELHYENIEPKIIAEKYIVDKSEELNDYKFLCFQGKVYYCWIDEGRFVEHRRNVYDLNWKLQSWNQFYYSNTLNPVPKPKNFSKMIELAEKLCSDFSHVRVDLYNVDGKIYFGEMTFTNGRGYEEIVPHEANLMLGNLWKLNE